MYPAFKHLTLTIVRAGCNNRCRHCSVTANESEPVLLSLVQIESIVEALRKEKYKTPPFYEHISPCLLYEPMDHPDIVSIHRLFYELNPTAPLVRTMATNGQRLAQDDCFPRLIDDLRDYGVEKFQLTLHGTQNTHD